MNEVLHVVTAHNEGMRGDVVVGGLPPVPGDTVRDKMIYFREHLDHLRRRLIFEPRGNLTRPVNFIVPSNDPEAAFGYIIALPTEYVAMSGSNTFCVATVLLETGMVPMTEPVTEFTLEAPAGLIRLRCECKHGKVTNVSFLNQPAFAYHHKAPVEVEGLGTVPVDVAWGGMTYAIVDSEALGFRLTADEASDLVRVGQLIKIAADAQLEAVHPLEPRFNGITQTMLAAPVRTVGGVLTSRNAVVVTPGLIDRCPCGSGTSARLAVLHARGEIAVGQTMVHESILDTRFRCQVDGTTTVADRPAVLPRVAGQSWITSIQQVGFDPDDPFPAGFTLGDLWHDIKALDRVAQG